MSKIKHWLEDEDGNLRIPTQDELDSFYIPKIDPWSFTATKDQNGKPIALQPKHAIGQGLESAALMEDLFPEVLASLYPYELSLNSLPTIGNEGIGSTALKAVKGLAKWIAQVLGVLYKALEQQSLAQLRVLHHEADRVRVSLRGEVIPESRSFTMRTHGRALSFRYQNTRNITNLINHYQTTSEISLDFFRYYFEVLLPTVRRLIPQISRVIKNPSSVGQLDTLVRQASPSQLKRSILTGVSGSSSSFVSKPFLGSAQLELTTREDQDEGLQAHNQTRLRIVRESQRFSRVTQQVEFERFGYSQASRLLDDVAGFTKQAVSLSSRTKPSDISGLVKDLKKLAEELTSIEVKPEDERHLPELAGVIRNLVGWVNTPYNGFYGGLLTTNRGCVRVCLENYRQR